MKEGRRGAKGEGGKGGKGVRLFCGGGRGLFCVSVIRLKKISFIIFFFFLIEKLDSK